MLNEKQELLEQAINEMKSREEKIEALKREVQILESQAYQIQGAIAMIHEFAERVNAEQAEQETEVVEAE